MSKQVAICHGEQVIDVTVLPGQTSADVLKAAGLPSSNWLSKSDGLALGETEVVYGLVRDGEKLMSSSRIDVGSGCEVEIKRIHEQVPA